jgi:hypothetical protein
VPLMNPMTGIIGFCALAATGQTTAALPSNETNSRRFM